jgi:hypothetical protein
VVGDGRAGGLASRTDALADCELGGNGLERVGEAGAEGIADAVAVKATPGFGRPERPIKRARTRAPTTTRRSSRLERERGRKLGTSLED